MIKLGNEQNGVMSSLAPALIFLMANLLPFPDPDPLPDPFPGPDIPSLHLKIF